MPDRVLHPVRPGHVLRVGRDPLVDLDGVLPCASVGESVVPRCTKRQRVRDGGRTRRTRGAKRPRQGPPLEPHPVATLQ